MNLLTIIIPHKNIPSLLVRCINSIPITDYINIIIIDDNSDSNIVDFDNFPGVNRKDTSVIYLKESLGAGFARNTGLKQVNSKWILFADADDFFENNAFDTLLNYYNIDCDIIYFKMMSCYSDTLEYADRHSNFNVHIDNYISDNNKQNEDYLRYSMPGPIAKLVKYDLILKHNIQFDEVIASNDVMFSAKIGYYANKILAVDKIIYIATIRKGSLTQTRNKQILYVKYYVAVMYSVYMKKIGKKELQSYLLSRVVDSLVFFGPIEFCKYVILAIKNKVNIFYGAKNIPRSFLRWYRRNFKNNNYITRK